MGAPAFEEPDLDAQEQALGVFYGGRNQWGGKLIVTDQRLLFAPLDLGAIPGLLGLVGGEFGIPSDVGLKVLASVKETVKKDVRLSHIESCDAHGTAGIFAPPKLRLVTATGDTFDVGIVKSTTTWNGDPLNNVVRDRALALIGSALAEMRLRR